MALKKAAKKAPVKKPVVKKLAPSEFEARVIVQLNMLRKDGYSITLKCEDRNKQVKEDECIIEYVREHGALELVGCKSGAPVRVVQVR